MNKLSKINKVLFTIMSTFLIFLSILASLRLISEMYPNNHYSDSNSIIISDEENNKLVKQNKRAQLITLNRISLVDSSKKIYIIPVSQIVLKRPEKIPSNSNTTPGELSMEFIDSKYYNYMSKDVLNNIIVLNTKTNSAQILYNERTCIVNHKIIDINSQKKCSYYYATKIPITMEN